MKFLRKFLNKKKYFVFSSVLFSILSTLMESIVIPRYIAATLNILKKGCDHNLFKNTLINLTFFYLLLRIIYMITNYTKKKLEPEITQYIVLELIKSVFIKYENENQLTNVTILINKINIIKKNLQELFYIMCTVFIPRTIVIFLGLYNFYIIDRTIWKVVTLCIIGQCILIFKDIQSCVNSSYDDLELKDKMFEYIEDVIYNIQMIQSTFSGYETELNQIKKLSEQSKQIETQSLNCVNEKQNTGYIINMFIFSICLYTIYKLYVNKNIDENQITIIILSLNGLFDNIFEMSFYIPELVSKLGILRNNKDFLEDLFKNIDNNEQEDDWSESSQTINYDSTIIFTNVSFRYDNHFILNDFTITIPEKKIIGLFGPSGSGKSTFIKLIFGIEKASSGSIQIGGYNLLTKNSSNIRKFISYMNQNTNNLFNKTVFENITYGIVNEEKQLLRQKIKDLLIQFDLYKVFSNLDGDSYQFSFLDKSVGKLGENLSGGQKALIHLLRLGLNTFSKIIILDEATAALDDNTRDNIIEYIRHLNKLGKSIFIVTHDTYFSNICQYIIQFSISENPKLVLNNISNGNKTN
jgi:ABC-type multidrug transport system fused ATPase/permease subunit